MATHPVHWEEGMFLRPHHFQAADRYARRCQEEVESWFQPFPWGYRQLTLDESRLGTESRVVVSECQVRFKDGTHLTVGKNADSPALELDLTEALKANEELQIYLAIPSFRLGVANVEEAASPRGPRFVVGSDDWPDENTGKLPQQVRVRKLQPQLMHSAQDRSGYETLPLVSVRRGTDEGSPPQIQGSAAPPLLSLDAWHWLEAEVAKVRREIRARLRQLAELAMNRELSFRSQDPGEAERLLKLHALNEVEPPLALLVSTPGIPPFPVYLELCRAVGRLGLFFPNRRPPKLPAYDHDHPGPGFAALITLIRIALEGAEPVQVISETFSRVGQHLQVSLQEGWIDLSRLYIGIETTLTADECDALLKERQIDRTIGSGAQVEELYTRRSRGLELTPVGRPDDLPRKAGVVYFRIQVTEPRIWQGVVNDRTLAVRFNVTQSPFVNDEEVRVVTTAGKKAQLRFMIFVVPVK